MKPGYFKLTYVLLILGLCISGLVSLSHGAYPVPFDQVLEVIVYSIFHTENPDLSLQHKIIIWDIRFPRLILSVLVGSALAVSGAAIQGLFRNPLADPGLIGVSGGAALGAVSVIVLSGSLMQAFSIILGFWAVPVAAFLGGLLVTSIIYKIATRSGHTSVATLLLAGIAINSIAGACIGLLTYIADDAQLRSLTFWSMGSLAQASWEEISIITPIILLPLMAIPVFAKALNAFLMGENVAHHLGFSILWVKRGVIICSAMAVGASVAVSGTIGFLGLVVPHLLRLTLGPDHKHLLPTSALAGALLLVLADLMARTVAAPAELPIGLLMSLLGGPFFLILLLSNKTIRNM